jgi:catechol 2,3-dioxygenase-like lactoylglutathione lyase family enzyme
VLPLIDLDHVAVAVEQHAEAFACYGRELGGRWLSSGLGSGFSPAQIAYANGMKVEILMPAQVEVNDFLRRFLDRNGPGPHHLTFKVPDLGAVLSRAEAAGYAPINVDRRDESWQEAFLHPRAIAGVLVQLAQTSGQMWATPPPRDWPSPGTTNPATLVRVAHAVADLAEGVLLFSGLLEGEEVTSGIDRQLGAEWLDLGWPGPGRLRLMTPTSPDSELAAWIGDRLGRVHHLAFACDDPGEVAGAVPHADGTWEVPPEVNLGTRLRLLQRF